MSDDRPDGGDSGSPVGSDDDGSHVDGGVDDSSSSVDVDPDGEDSAVDDARGRGDPDGDGTRAAPEADRDEAHVDGADTDGSPVGRDVGGGASHADENAPGPVPGTSASRSDGRSDDFLTRFRTAQTGPLAVVREVLVSVAAVVAFGLLLYAISGIWPPMVAIESGSMEPNMQVGDLVFVTEPQRFSPDYAFEDTGVVPYDVASEREYRSFGDYGTVIVFDPPTRRDSPIIHRARFWVADGENWYDRANPEYVDAENCAELLNCPAPHAGFVTKGDANSRYDQANGLAEPVRKEWVEGAARLRIPYLGYIRLELAGYTGPITFERPEESVSPSSAEPLRFESTDATVSRTDRSLAVR
jgi:signal peptidase